MSAHADQSNLPTINIQRTFPNKPAAYGEQQRTHLNELPHLVAPRPEDVAPANIVVAYHLRKNDNVGIPHGEVLLLLPLQGQEGLALLHLLLVLVDGLGGSILLVLLGNLGLGLLPALLLRLGTGGRGLPGPLLGLLALVLPTSTTLLGKVHHDGFHPQFGQIVPQLRRRQHRAGIVPEGMGVDTAFGLEQILIQHQRDVPLGIVGDGERSDAALGASQLGHQHIFRGEAEIDLPLEF